MVAAPRGVSSRLAGLASLIWGLTVWVFGESFGGIFAPGLTWLAGAPGAALLYAVAGALLLLPDRSWQTARLGRMWLAVLGAFLAGMALLQAWPGRGFWPGPAGSSGTLASLVQAAAERPPSRTCCQSWYGSRRSPPLTACCQSGRRHRLGGHRPGVPTGLPRWSGPPWPRSSGLCLVDWVLVEDLGFLGGVGTDPGSMIPMVLLAAAGYLALTRPLAPVPAAELGQSLTSGPVRSGGRTRQRRADRRDPIRGRDTAGPDTAGRARGTGRRGNRWWARVGPAALRRPVNAASFGAMASLGAAA